MPPLFFNTFLPPQILVRCPTLHWQARRAWFAPVLLVLALSSIAPVLSGCRAGSASPYAAQSDAPRDPLHAQELTLQAAALLQHAPPDLRRAESLLRAALVADLYHGPAHNNLGVVYLKQHDLYRAASEFEWARKLLPGSPDPRTNLALTLERAGRTEDALHGYASALEIQPDHIPTLQALTRLEVRSSRRTDLTRSQLETIALNGTTAQWREWAASEVRRNSTHDSPSIN